MSVCAAEDADAFLKQTGMPQEEISLLDKDVKQYMVNDMKNAGNKEFEYVETEAGLMAMPKGGETLDNISFTASAFKSGSTIYIYPTYEFTNEKKPRGKDSFSFKVGDAIRPYEYGGQTWYKDYTMTNWASGGTMTANNPQLDGAEYSGTQLGSPDLAMKIKGCAYCHATAGAGTDKRIVMGYLYNPNRIGYSISFSYGGFGISYSPSGTAYSAGKLTTLSY